MEHSQIDELFRQLDKKPDRVELDNLRLDISNKMGRHDFDMLQVNFNNFRIEVDQRLKSTDKDIDEFID